MIRPPKADRFTVDDPPPFEDWPAVYALRCFGRCCEPELVDGCSVVVDRQAPYADGDFIAVWSRDADGFIEAMVKRLVFGLAPWVRWPYRPRPLGDTDPVLMVEMLNPARRFALDLSKVYAVHRCIGVAGPRPGVAIGTDVCSADIRWFDRRSRPARLRKPRVFAGGADG